MKSFLVLLVLGYASSDKLDRTYLPPPGSQYSGGRPEDIQVPFEFPKETYSTTLRPQDYDGGITNPEDSQATIGINRGLPTESLDSGITPGSKAPPSYFQNTYKVPTTTVSYAFTQTTTHPPTEGFETTIGPQFGTGLPNQDIFNNFQSQEPSLIYQDNFGSNQPSFENAGGQFIQNPTVGPNTQIPGYPNQPKGSLSTVQNQQAQTRPNYQQNTNQVRGQRPSTPTSGPLSQFAGSLPQGPNAIYENNVRGQDQNVPGYKPGTNQFVGQNPTSAPISGTFSQLPAEEDVNLRKQGQFNPNQKLTVSPQPISEPSLNTVRPGMPFGQSQYRNQTSNNGFFDNKKVSKLSTVSPQGFESTSRPSTAYDNEVNTIQDFPTPDQTVYQQYPGIQNNEEYANNGNQQNGYQPSSTFAPTTLIPGVPNRQFSESVVPGAYSTQNYPGAQFNGQVTGAPVIYSPRPERPQDDADRNAVILNYENIITPEGYFSYSFDTSNGIHADESGTAADGVKAKGSYSYTGDDGKFYLVEYTADENGYQPRGDHLPTPPPIPKAIQEVIEKVNKEKEAGIYHDGSYDDGKYGHHNYQGVMRYRPHSSNKHFSNGAELPDEFISNMRPSRPQTGRKPIVSSGGLSDSDNLEQDQYIDDDGNTPGRLSTQRPISRVTIPNDQGNNDNQGEYIEVTSKRPLKQPSRKQFNQVKGVSSDGTRIALDDDRRYPDEKSSLNQTQDEKAFEYGSEEPYNENDGDTSSNKGPFRLTGVNKQRPQYENNHSTGKFYNEGIAMPGSYNRPDINESSDENENIRMFNGKVPKRPVGKLSGRYPTSRPVIGNNQDQFTTDETLSSQNRNKILSNTPYEYFEKDGAPNVSSEYDNEEYVTKPPSQARPDNSRPSRPDKTISRNQTSDRRQPSYSSKIPALENGYTKYTTENNGQYIESDDFDKGDAQEYDNRRRPIISKPTKTSNQYDESEQEVNGNIPSQNNYNNPAYVSPASYDGRRGKPQMSRPNDGAFPSVPENINQGLEDKGSKVSGVKFGQKFIKPSFNQQTGNVDGLEYNQRPVNETGYQYIPPRRKFEKDEVNGFPTRYTGTTRVPSTRRPQLQNMFYDKVDVKSKPFVTPNVSRDETGFSEDEYDQEEGTPEGTRIINGPEDEYKQYSQYPDTGTTPDQIYGDETISSTKRPLNKYTSSTYGPSSTTGRPQYTQNAPGFVNYMLKQTQNRRPIHGNDNKFTAKTPYGGITSTTLSPSTRPYFGSTYGPTTPEQQNTYTSDNTYRTPAQGIISTTQIPSQEPTFGGTYQQNTNVPQFQSTYRPSGTLRPTTQFIDGPSSPRPTISSTYSPSNVGRYESTQYGKDLPSTTYRPNYTTAGLAPSTTATPGVVVDGFGRPIKPGYSSNDQDYIPGANSEQRPINTSNVRIQQGDGPSGQSRGQQRYQPGVKAGQQRVTSGYQTSTEKIIGEDFSGPKQQQKFDPETGYYYK